MKKKKNEMDQVQNNLLLLHRHGQEREKNNKGKPVYLWSKIRKETHTYECCWKQQIISKIWILIFSNIINLTFIDLRNSWKKFCASF